MNSEQAENVAEALAGVPWNSGGSINLVGFKRADGHLVVISDEVICEYENEEAFDEGRPIQSILLH
ncbi:MAG TPA: hypothetical protein VLI39_00910 [Sedimentisphaerales bacterium]|nr:hypothetical protein [Sedimentisphaerales bacterium]